MVDKVYPAWNDLLSALPEALHGAVIPHLQKFSQNADNAVTQVKEQYKAYDAYKPLVDNKIPIERIGDALGLAQNLESDPEATVKNIVEHWDLGFVPKDSIPSNDDPYDDDGDGTVDITKNPAFQAMSKQLELLTGQLTQKQQADLEAQELAVFNKEIDDHLKKDENKHVPRDLLVAYMSQDWTADDATAEINKLIGKGVALPGVPEGNTPPVIMGGSAEGSGLPDQSINFGKMRKSDVDDTVMKALQAIKDNNNQG